MFSGKGQSGIKPNALGAMLQASTYGATIPTIYGRTKSPMLLIWANCFREGPSSKKYKKKGGKKGDPPTFNENVDFLLGSNPIQGVLQFWRNKEEKFPLDFTVFSTTLPTGPDGTKTISDSAFYFVIGVTVEVNLSGTFDDYGAEGPVAYSVTQEFPMWNCALHGPDLTDASCTRWYPFVYKWEPADGNVVTFPSIQTFFAPSGSLPNCNGNLHIYYAKLPTVNLFHKQKGTGLSPAAMLRLTFEDQLGNGPEYTSCNPSQQIIYPYYAGLGSPNYDLGTTGQLPDVRPEVMGSYSIYSTGDADFADMIEDVIKSGMLQVGKQIGEIHRGLNCVELPGVVQKRYYQNLEPMTPFSMKYFQPNKAGNVLLAYVRWRTSGGGTAPDITDSAGNTWTSIATGLNYGMWYVASANASSSNQVTFTYHGNDFAYDISAHIMEIDDGHKTVTTNVASGTSTTPSASITTTGPALLISMLAMDQNTNLTLVKPHWELVFPVTKVALGTPQSNTRVARRIVDAAGTYSISYTSGISGAWTLGMVAIQNPEPLPYPKPFGNILDATTMQQSRDQARAGGLYGSITMDSQRKASEWLENFYTAMNTAPVWSGFKLKSIPRSEVSAVGNGVVYTSPTASGPVANIKESDFIGPKDTSPVSIDRKARLDAPNVLQMQHINRSSDYNQILTTQPDIASIALFGTRKDSPKLNNAVQDVAIARKLLMIESRRSSYLRNIYKFKLNAKWQWLEAMDLITITEPQLGLDTLPVRLTKVVENDSDELECEAEPFLYGVHSPDTLAVTTHSPYAPPLGADPGSVNSPIFFEPVPRLYGVLNQQQLWIVVSSSDPDYGGAGVFLSTDNGISYNQVGTVLGNGTTGVVAVSTWPASADPDTINDLFLDLSESRGALVSYSALDRDNFTFPSYVEGGTASIPYELIAYNTVQQTNTYAYTIKATGAGNSIRRAVFDAPQVGSGVAHTVGQRFAFLGGVGGPTDQGGAIGVFKINMDLRWCGKTLYWKFPAFNTLGGGVQTLSAATAYAYTPACTVPSVNPNGDPPGGFFINGQF